MTTSTNYDTVILDIEGTITPITFVKDVLVSYYDDVVARYWFTDFFFLF
jgi:methionine salvage enolase-phosphatase E1